MAHITVIGTGMVGLNQLTQEATAALERARHVFVISFDQLVLQELERRYRHVTDLGYLYEAGVSREVTYKLMVDEVLRSAVAAPPICVAIYGHPYVFVTPTPRIVEEAKSVGMTVSILPGISAMDGLFIDLELDPATHGLQMYEATDLILRRRPLVADVPALIWQVGTVGTLVYEEVLKPGVDEMNGFVTYLSEYYPMDHVVTLARTRTMPVGGPRLISVPLRELSAVAHRVGPPDTLYIPEVVARDVHDSELLSRLRR